MKINVLYDMEKETLHFDNNFLTYNKIRPGYPKEIYEMVSKHKKLDGNSAVLEIGAGNGIASREIYDNWHPKLTLIEPGKNFCSILAEQFTNIKDIKIENTTFDKYNSTILYDAIFSATAFHWLDISLKYKKSFEMLKEDGLLVLYWNYYGIEDTEMENSIQSIYLKYGMGTEDGKNGYEKQIDKINSRRKEIEESNYFKILEHKSIKRIIEYSASDNTK
ncbi:MAG: class I SAM-dependent methyltransferase, partial [Treponema sp.]|nr:class I SAM-dependent methyltransferase [Treponema sp.]